MSYLAEYAKSGRSSCRGCRSNIGNRKLRIGKVVPLKRHKGLDTCWYHPRCFFSNHEGVTEYEISKLDELTEGDQDLVKKYIAGVIPFEAPPPEDQKPDEQENESDQIPNIKSGLDGLQNSGDFYVEYARSNKSRCLSCERNISKSEVRISQKDYTSVKALRIPGHCLDRWYHLDCFAYNRRTLEFYKCADEIPGFLNLKPEDKAVLLEKLPAVVDENNTNVEPADVGAVAAPPISPMDRLKERIRAELTPQKIAAVLTYNKQNVPRETDKMVESLADIMLLGAPSRCASCGGEFILSDDSSYQCVGFLSNLSNCTELQGSPPRKPFTVPPGETELEIFKESSQMKQLRLSRKRPLPLPSATEKKVLKLRNVQA